MDTQLRIDLTAILLEECFGMQPAYARKLAATRGSPHPDERFHRANVDALDMTDKALRRIEARCSTIEG